MTTINNNDYIHLMLLSSNYNKGKRICLHFVVDEKNDISDIISKYKNKENVALYQIITNDKNTESVVEKEPFFSEVQFYEGNNSDDVKMFSNLVESVKIEAFDIALYILTKNSLDYATLMIYLYYLYCLFEIKVGKELFNDSIKCSDYYFSMFSMDKHFEREKNIKFLSQDIFDEYVIKGRKYRADRKVVVLSKMISIFKNRDELLLIDKFIDILNSVDVNLLRENIFTPNSPFYLTSLFYRRNNENILKKKTIDDNKSSFDFLLKYIVDVY